MPDTSKVTRLWIEGRETPTQIEKGSLVIEGEFFTAKVGDGGPNIGGPLATLKGYAWDDDDEPEPPEPEPPPATGLLLYTDVQFAKVAAALSDPTSVQSQQWAKCVGTFAMNPNRNPTPIAVIDSSDKSSQWISDSQAAHGLALRARLDADSATREKCVTATIRFIDGAVNATTFVNSNYNGADGKLTASWALPNYCQAMTLVRGSVDDAKWAKWCDWLVKVGLDGHTDATQRGGTIYDVDTGEAIRGSKSSQPLMGASAQVGGSLLDHPSGANWLMGFDYAKACIGITVGGDRGAQIVAEVRKRFVDDFRSVVFWHTDEHPTLGVGYPWPPTPPPEGQFSGYDTADEMAKYWHFASAALARYFDGLTEEMGRDMSHAAMAIAPAFMFCLVMENAGLGDYATDADSGVDHMLDRLLAMADLFAGTEHEAIDQAWAANGGDFAALEKSSWTPTLNLTDAPATWVELNLGSKSTGKADWKHAGSAADYCGFYMHWYLADIGVDLPNVTALVERVRVVDANAPRSSTNIAGTGVPNWGNQQCVPALMFSPVAA